MSKRDIRDVYDERNSVLRAMKKLSQKAITENRGFTKEENAQA